MKKKIKKICKEHSLYMIILTLAEMILSFVTTLAFVYSDTLNYSDSMIFEEMGIAKLLESMYSSTWWALILLLLAFIAIFHLTAIVYKKMEYAFISMCCLTVMLILSINLNQSLINLLSIFCLFIPIYVINIVAYKNEARKIKKASKK